MQTLLLAAALLLAPLGVTAQTQYKLLDNLRSVVLTKPAPVYLSLADTLTASPLQMEPGQTATIKAVVNDHWWVLWQALDYEPMDMYVRAANLADATPYETPATRKKQ